MTRGSLTNFCATCLYFAALALWTYGTAFTPGSSAQRASNFVGQQGIFLLDSEVNNVALHRFVVSGQGIPALSSADYPVCLEDRAAVMRIFQQVLRSNHFDNTVPQQLYILHHAFSALGSFGMTNC